MHIRRWRNHAITQMRHTHVNVIKQTKKQTNTHFSHPSHVIEVVESPVGGAEAERLLARVVPAHGLPVSPCGAGGLRSRDGGRLGCGAPPAACSKLERRTHHGARAHHRPPRSSIHPLRRLEVSVINQHQIYGDDIRLCKYSNDALDWLGVDMVI